MEFDLVFEGGGAKGSVFVGALEEFEKRGHTARRRVGTSAGSIVATLLTAGYTPQELLAAVNEKIDGKSRFTTFMDTPESFDESVIKNSITIEAHNKAFPVAISGPGDIFASIDGFIQKHLMDALMKLPPYRQVFSFVEVGGLFAGDKFLEWIIEK